MRANWYLVAVVCFLVATIAGLIGLLASKGHWSQVAIPLALLIMALILWGNARRRQA